MKVLEGIINLKHLKGSEVLQIDETPLAKKLSDLNGETITLCVDDFFNLPLVLVGWLKSFISKASNSITGELSL